MSGLTEQQAGQLLSITTVEDVRAFLKGIGAMSGNGWKWVPLGGRENNAGSVNLAVESGQALVERITNGLDAHIELKYELTGRPIGLDSPKSGSDEILEARSRSTIAAIRADGPIHRQHGTRDRSQSRRFY